MKLEIMKYLSILILFCACSNVSFDQKASTFSNKGITSDALLDAKGNFYICGETSVFTSGKPSQAVNKDAFFVYSNDFGKTFHGYSYGEANQAERFERILTYDNSLILSGFYGDSKSKFLLRVLPEGKPVWAIQSEIYKTFDQGDVAVDPTGNILLSSKNPTDDAYLGFMHLIDKEGNCKWSKRMSAMEIMQDIICTRDSQFIISYKQKGAFIDGSTRKKYWMNSFHKINKEGSFIWSNKFHIEVDQASDCVFNKVLEDQAGNLYFIGRIELLKSKGHDLFIIKTNSTGTILWSSIYATSNEFAFKNACFHESGNLLLVADGYGKNGGLVYMEMKPDGVISWSKIKATANYEQVINILPGKNKYAIVWDKLLNFSTFTMDAKGNSCYTDVKEQIIERQNFPVLLDTYHGSWDPAVSDWKKIEISLLPHSEIPLTNECK